MEKKFRFWMISLGILLASPCFAQDDPVQNMGTLDQALVYSLTGTDQPLSDARLKEYLTQHFKFETYTVKAGDNYWDLAVRLLDDGFQWPLIWFMNREKYPHPGYLLPGAVILVPIHP
jgi:nucleoid-associated protein YgaU